MTITEDILYVGVNDHQVDLFEGQFAVPEGMAYNSYVILDEKVAVMDSVDAAFTNEWISNLNQVLAGRQPDYLVVQHMEPDHAASVGAFAAAYPAARIVGNNKTFQMLENFFPELSLEARKEEVKNGESLSLGRHTLTFLFAPMVHWPEVMFTYDSRDRVLFSADAFGKFGALDAGGDEWDCEARRYYFGIVGKYGPQVQTVLKKAAALEIAIIAPLHGPVLKENLEHYLRQYDIWSSYRPEDEGVMIAYTSVYGNTKRAAEYLAGRLKEKGRAVVLTDLARSDMAEAVEDAFRYDKLVLATTTYNAELYPAMRTFLEELAERNFQNRTVGLIENGSWAPMAAKLMRTKLEKSRDIAWLETGCRILSSVKPENYAELDAMADELCQ